MASEASASRAYVLYGVAGCGKTTLGRALVERLNDAEPETERDAVFVDADDLHSPEAREKMTRGEPLTETDREPWLARVRARMLESARPRELAGTTTHRVVVVACSALRRDHRASLVRDVAEQAPWLASVDFVFLRAARATLEKRLVARQEAPDGHFFPASLLRSQLDALELPAPEDHRTICHVFDADAFAASARVAAAALASALEAVALARAEWEETARAFLDDWYGRLERAGLADVLTSNGSNAQIDHVCFRCSSASSYRDALARLRRAGHVVAGSTEVGGREIATVRLRPPIRWRGFSVPAVEVPMPKEGRPKPDGWEHAEVALMRGGVEGVEHLEALRAEYPDAPWDAKGMGKALNAELSCVLAGEPAFAVKFHHRPLLEVVAYEIERGMAEAPPPPPTFANETPTRLGKRASRGDGDGDAGLRRGTTRAELELPVFADPRVTFGLEMREPWVGMVLSGEKTVETRGYALPEALLRRPVVLLAAPEAPRLRGSEGVLTGLGAGGRGERRRARHVRIVRAVRVEGGVHRRLRPAPRRPRVRVRGVGGTRADRLGDAHVRLARLRGPAHARAGAQPGGDARAPQPLPARRRRRDAARWAWRRVRRIGRQQRPLGRRRRERQAVALIRRRRFRLSSRFISHQQLCECAYAHYSKMSIARVRE